MLAGLLKIVDTEKKAAPTTTSDGICYMNRTNCIDKDRESSLSPSQSDNEDNEDTVEEVDANLFGCFASHDKQKYLNSLTVKDIYEKNNQFAISYHSTQNQSMN